jgi:hypothetical protein
VIYQKEYYFKIYKYFRKINFTKLDFNIIDLIFNYYLPIPPIIAPASPIPIPAIATVPTIFVVASIVRSIESTGE